MKKFFQLFTGLLPLWVIIISLAGYMKPATLVFLRPHMEWLFGLTMLGIGAVLNFDELKGIAKKPVPVLLGTLTQFTVMPLAGFALGRVLGLSPAFTLGLVLVGSTPGAMASNVISYLAGADVAYSIALTSTSTFLAPLLTPALTYVFANAIIEVNFLQMFLNIIKIVILPLCAGFIIRKKFRCFIEKHEYFFPAFSTVFIALICGLVVALNRHFIGSSSLVLMAAIIIFNFLGLVSGYFAAKLYGFDEKRTRTLSFEVGMQNAGLGAVLALKHFSAETALPNALFAVWCVITASIMVRVWNRKQHALRSG